MMSSGEWASEIARLPWRTDIDYGRRIVDADSRPIATFADPRDAQHVVACVNSLDATGKPARVRFIRTDLWLGECYLSTPTHLMLGPSAMATLAMLAEHYRTEHTPTPEQLAAAQLADFEEKQP